MLIAGLLFTTLVQQTAFNVTRYKFLVLDMISDIVFCKSDRFNFFFFFFFANDNFSSEFDLDRGKMNDHLKYLIVTVLLSHSAS